MPGSPSSSSGGATPRDALTELEPLGPEAWQDASLRHVRGRAFEASGNTSVVEASLGEPKDVASSYGPWWAIRGRFARSRGDDPAAEGFFLEAIAADPFDIESACETLDAAGAPSPRSASSQMASPAQKDLCEAARRRDEPGIGND